MIRYMTPTPAGHVLRGGRIAAVSLSWIAAVVAVLAATIASPAAATEPTGPAEVWLIGDSITEGLQTPQPAVSGFGAQTVRRICGDRAACPRANYVGNGGQCLLIEGCNGHPRMLDSIDDVLAKSPAFVVIEVGRNDLCHFSDADLRRGYRAIARKVRNAGAQPVMATLTPANAKWPYPCEDQRAATSEWIRDTFRRVVDLEPALADADGALAPQYDSGDGLHPNSVGARALARAVVTELRAIGVQTRPRA